MSLLRPARAALRTALFGADGFRHQGVVGLPDPQPEVSVWLHGLGAPLDVTGRHVIAAAVPNTIGIGLERPLTPAPENGGRASLIFRERAGRRRLLGEIGLKLEGQLPAGAGLLYLFRTTLATNYCATQAQLWWIYFAAQYQRLLGHESTRAASPPALREARCAFVFYNCPRPVVVVSVKDGSDGSIFPMDLVGWIGPRSFSLALHHSRAGAALMESARQIALSSVPVEQAPLVYALGANHRNARVDWNALPFATRRSAAYGLPVPSFALRVREMRITAVHNIAAYKLFLAEVVADGGSSDGPTLHIVHGLYAAWRKRR